MFERFDETILLAYVEGELSEEAAAALRLELTGHPEVQAALDRMRADRLALRSLGEPDVPADLLAPLESLLARPMLLEPGEYRRRVHGGERRRRMVLAVAGVAVVVGGAVLASLALRGGGGDGPELVAGSGTGAEGPASPTVPAPVAAPVRVAAAPPPGPDQPGVAGPGDRVALSTPQPLAGPVALRFALVIPAAEMEAAEAILRDAVNVDGGALVQNFSEEEARSIDRWLATQARGRGGRGPLMADLSRDAKGAEPDLRRLRQDLMRLDAATRPNLSQQLAGAEALAPPYSEQLRLSAHGATHTITLPLRSLSELLARIHRATGAATSLALLDQDPADGTSLWTAQRDVIQRSIDELEARDPGAVIYLPVRVSVPPARGG